MAENVQSAILEILKRLKSDMSDVKDRLGGIEGRLDKMQGSIEKLETHAKKQNADSAAMLVMMRATVPDFNERETDIGDDIRLIKRRS